MQPPIESHLLSSPPPYQMHARMPETNIVPCSLDIKFNLSPTTRRVHNPVALHSSHPIPPITHHSSLTLFHQSSSPPPSSCADARRKVQLQAQADKTKDQAPYCACGADAVPGLQGPQHRILRSKKIYTVSCEMRL